MEAGTINEKQLLRKGQRILRTALQAVKPEVLIRKSLTRQRNDLAAGNQIIDLNRIRRIHAAAIGKAAPYMAKAAAGILNGRLDEGVFLQSPEENHRIKHFTGLPAPHPLPDERSREAARKILELAEKSGPDDLFLLCISGGGSAQLSCPPPGITMEEKRNLTGALLRAGADIFELNVVRKHLSLVKGGRLAMAAHPAMVLNVVISDVIGNDMETIASGPAWKDTSTFLEAVAVLRKYGLWDKAAVSVQNFLWEGFRREKRGGPVSGHPVFRKVSHVIAGDNRTALSAARGTALREGLAVSVLTSGDQGEAREAAGDYVRTFMAARNRMSRPFCLIAGGELTVTVKGEGKGGRNQEFVLAFLEEMRRRYPQEENWAVFSLGTDGTDGPTEAAGARGGSSILKAAAELSLRPLDHLINNDSYSFFKSAGGLIVTGPTHTNVMDIRLFLSG